MTTETNYSVKLWILAEEDYVKCGNRLLVYRTVVRQQYHTVRQTF